MHGQQNIEHSGRSTIQKMAYKRLSTNFPKICKPPRNHWCQKCHIKKVLYWEFTTISNHHTKLSNLGDEAPGICEPLRIRNHTVKQRSFILPLVGGARFAQHTGRVCYPNVSLPRYTNTVTVRPTVGKQSAVFSKCGTVVKFMCA